MLKKHRKMSSNTYQQIALILLVLCIVSPIESRYEQKDRKPEKSIGIQQSTQPQLAAQQTTLNLCKKDRTLAFLCHCTPEDESIKAQKGLPFAFHVSNICAKCFLIHSGLLDHQPRNLTQRPPMVGLQLANPAAAPQVLGAGDR